MFHTVFSMLEDVYEISEGMGKYGQNFGAETDSRLPVGLLMSGDMKMRGILC